MGPYETILCEADGDDGVAVLTLNRPRSLNAISRRLADELADALTQLAADDSVRVLVLRGAGDNFCAGGDVRDMDGTGARGADDTLEAMARYRRMTLALHQFPRPVIAAVDGVAFGAGMSLALLADLVVLSDRARLCMAFQRVALIPDCGALHTLPRLVGLQQAKALMYSAREIGAAEAHAMGLALEVVAAPALHTRALELAQAIARQSRTAMTLTKKALDAALRVDMTTMLDMEAAGQAIALTSREHRAAVQSFLSGRRR
jgi:2-(1,2-epoxy-1,2-dihydrophenyl)acetyl-CoA isomerase